MKVLPDSITEAEIETTIRVLSALNRNTAYGHYPELCRATNSILMFLKIPQQNPSDIIRDQK